MSQAVAPKGDLSPTFEESFILSPLPLCFSFVKIIKQNLIISQNARKDFNLCFAVMNS